MGNEKLSTEQDEKLWECFRRSLTARRAAEVVGVQPNTAASHYRKIRERIWGELKNELTMDYSAHEFKGKEPLFGIVYVPEENRFRTVIFSEDMVLRAKEDPGAALPSLITVFDKADSSTVRTSQHSWIGRTTKCWGTMMEDEYLARNFWRKIKKIMGSYNSVRREDLDFYLKECEWKFAHRRASPR